MCRYVQGTVSAAMSWLLSMAAGAGLSVTHATYQSAEQTTI